MDKQKQHVSCYLYIRESKLVVRWLSKIVGTKRIKAPNLQDIIYEVVLRWEPTDLFYFTREINSRSLTTINEYSSKNVSEYNLNVLKRTSSEFD